MGTKHIRHLVTELAARLSDRDFLRKAGISRRTMQEIFVRDKWEEALESLFPIRERLSCKQILELCHPELWALSGEPEEGWISFTYKFSTHILYPDPEFSEKAASYARGAYVYLNVLQFFFDEERKAVPSIPSMILPCWGKRSTRAVTGLENTAGLCGNSGISIFMR